jgi:tape measure domain-containing protein
MSSTNADLIVRLRNARQARRDAQQVAGGIRQIGTASAAAGASARVAGREINGAFAAAAAGARRGVLAVGSLAAAGALMGLKFNAQVESARERFRLFTDDVDGLTKAVQGIDSNSQFNFGGLSDAAAMVGNSGVKDIPRVLQGAANAAAASGKGEQALQGIVVALSQIQAKGKLSQEEINQLNDAGAPGAQKIIQRAFGLTAKQVGNLGAQGLDANKAIDALTKAWTSGKMASAAERQLHTLGGQWDLFTGNVQKLSGAATKGLSDGLAHNVLPAANAAVEQITRIFGTEGLSNEQKLRQAREAIRRNLGPIADDLIQKIRDAHLADKLDHEFERAMDKMTVTAVHQAPHIVSRFVDAWLSAGPWAKLVSGAWVAKKLGIGTGILAALKALSGAGKGRGGLAGAAGKLAPIPVFVTNPGFAGNPEKSVAKKALDTAKKAAPTFAAAATRALPFAVDLSLPLAALSIPIAAAFYDTKPKPVYRAPHVSQKDPSGGVAFNPAAPYTRSMVTQGTLPKPVPASPVVVNSTIHLTVDGKQLTSVFDRQVADAKARR